MMAWNVALRLLAFRVPRNLRAEWLAEWLAELHFVSRSLHPSLTPWQRTIAIAAFCRGAIPDGQALHTLNPVETTHHTPSSHSPVACIGTLALLALLSFALAQIVPASRRASANLIPVDTPDIVSISPPSEAEAGPRHSMTLGTACTLARQPQHLFTDFAFYQPIQRPLHLAPHREPLLRVARSSQNLLTLLNLPISLAPSAQASATPTLILSEATWRNHLSSTLPFLGSTLRLGLQTVRLGGIVRSAPGASPPQFDAWLLLPDQAAAALAPNTPVVLLARLAPHPTPGPMDADRWHLAVPQQQTTIDYVCHSLTPHRPPPTQIFLFTLVLALLCLPATAPLAPSDHALQPLSLPGLAALRRGLFFAAKLAFGLPAIFFAALTLAAAIPSTNPNTPEYLQLTSSFAATLFLLRWALRDQRRRCPVCLSPLSCPARVGEPSRNFLSWNGTELLCTGGHGFLHVPELPTSWFAAPRWLHLDPTWRSLFPGPA